MEGFPRLIPSLTPCWEYSQWSQWGASSWSRPAWKDSRGWSRPSLPPRGYSQWSQGHASSCSRLAWRGSRGLSPRWSRTRRPRARPPTQAGPSPLEFQTRSSSVYRQSGWSEHYEHLVWSEAGGTFRGDCVDDRTKVNEKIGCYVYPVWKHSMMIMIMLSRWNIQKRSSLDRHMKVIRVLVGKKSDVGCMCVMCVCLCASGIVRPCMSTGICLWSVYWTHVLWVLVSMCVCVVYVRARMRVPVLVSAMWYACSRVCVYLSAVLRVEHLFSEYVQGRRCVGPLSRARVH